MVAILQLLFAAFSFILIWSIEDTLLAELSQLLILQVTLPQIFGLYGTQLLRKINISYSNVFALSLVMGTLAGALASFITQNISIFSIIFASVVAFSISYKLRSDEKLIKGTLLESLPRLIVISLSYWGNSNEVYSFFNIIFVAILLILILRLGTYIRFIFSFDLRRQLNFSSSNGLKVIEGIFFPIFVPQEMLALIIRGQTLLRPAELVITGILRQFEISIIEDQKYQRNVSRIACTVFALSGIPISIMYNYGLNIFSVQITAILFIQVWILHILKIIEYSLGFPGVRIRNEMYNRSLEIFLKATLSSVMIIGVALCVYRLCFNLDYGFSKLLELVPFVIFGSITVVYKVGLWLSYNKYYEKI